jgi:1-acyl-sn-glycerol-3-phosphate acyltransferase
VPTLDVIDNQYRSPDTPPGLLARLLPGLLFWPGVFLVVWRGSTLAKRHQYSDEEWSRSSLNTLRLLERAGVRFEVTGLEHVASVPGPCVFIGNHMSTLETFVLPVILLPFTRVTFVVKESLLTYPLFGPVMRSRDPVAVGRTNPREDLTAVLEGGAARLAAGISLIIFPQTTRTSAFDPQEFNSIGIKLAKRAGVPVVPLALKTDAWGNGKFAKDFGKIDPAKRVHFAFGAPMRIQGRGAEEQATIVAFITEHLHAWGGTVRQ